MSTNMKFVIFVFWGVLLFFIYYLLILFEKNRLMHFFKNEREKIKIFEELVGISRAVHDRTTTLRKYPSVFIYLLQAEYIINNYGFDFNDTEVSVLNKSLKNSVLRNDLIGEIYGLDIEILGLVKKCSDTLGRIYKIKHPLKYRYYELCNRLKLILKDVYYRLIKEIPCEIKFTAQVSYHTVKFEECY